MRWNDHYMDRDTAAAVNGFFILLVFVRHILQYREFAGAAFLPLQLLSKGTGQLIVVSFLFFSGYGVMESCRTGGDDYVDGIPRRRIASTWIRFVLAVSLYLVLQIFMGRKVSVSRLAAAFLGWESIGNSSWYIFVILWLYLFSFLSMKTASRLRKPEMREIAAVLIQGILTMAMIWALSRWKESYWYNTALAYTAGMLFSSIRTRWESWMMERPIRYLLQWCAVLALWAIVFCLREYTAAYEAAAILAAFTLILILTKVDFAPPPLIRTGRHLFGMYMGQRLLMIALAGSGCSDLLYLILCFVGMFPVGWLLDVGTGYAVRRLHR